MRAQSCRRPARRSVPPRLSAATTPYWAARAAEARDRRGRRGRASSLRPRPWVRKPWVREPWVRDRGRQVERGRRPGLLAEAVPTPDRVRVGGGCGDREVLGRPHAHLVGVAGGHAYHFGLGQRGGLAQAGRNQGPRGVVLEYLRRNGRQRLAKVA